MGFFLHSASFQLASDNAAWLRGETPTVLDSHRLVPRLFFLSLHALFGPSAVAALSLLFLFHALNTLFVYRLGKRLFEGQVTALVAAAVFVMNPITLNTLTWISCLSYVLGTGLALCALLAFLKANEPNARYPFICSAGALVSLGLGL